MTGNSTLFMIVAVFGLILWRRTRAMRVPMKGSGLRLVLPPIFMSIGFVQLSSPDIHVTLEEALVTIALGLLLSIPMIVTTNYEIREDGNIYAKRSKAFIAALAGLLVIRLALRNYIGGIDQATMLFLFFLLAVCYIVPWRIVSFVKYRSVLRMKTANDSGAE
ncbi:CcdC family protein [Paenibacillus contaminans]|uniref:Cobalamin biosynthesis protein CbiX n=1 Tax=Paenibacillus contaminans TaxID=450362 RepID=A0A329MQS6_9BACL|nr:cytochrome c biogenesis protein CcdC [Paenibacillus contaminans]RAV21788.1 cobalamin biosynthesis protein CbiX [Paenibacillus contaminans]